MDGIQHITLSGEQIFQASLAMKSSTSEMLSSVTQRLDDISLDKDGNNIGDNYYNVSRDYSVLGAGINSANIQAKIIAKNEQAELEKQNKENQAQLRDGATSATAAFKEMMSFNGYEFSVEAMQETAGEALSDFERLMREKGWSAEQSETIHEALVVLHDPNRSDAQREQAMNNIDHIDSQFANELAQDAEEKDINNENKISDIENKTQSNELDTMLSDAPSEIPATNTSSSRKGTFDLDKPESEITATFTDEVNNVGANAQSFSLDEAPQVAVTENSPATFSLDALS